MTDLLVKLLLSFLTYSFSILAGLSGVFFIHSLPATSLSTTHHALAVALCFFVPHCTARLCVDLLSNTVDTLFVCFALDKESGQNHCSKAAQAVRVVSYPD